MTETSAVETTETVKQEDAQSKEAATLFPDITIETAGLGAVTVRPLSFKRLMALTPILEGLVARMKIEGISIDPDAFEPSLSEMVGLYLVTAPLAIDLMSAITGLKQDDFDELTIPEGAQIFVACTRQCWAQIAPFLGAFIRPKPAVDVEPQS